MTRNRHREIRSHVHVYRYNIKILYPDDARKIFQIIGALPSLPNGDVDMARRLLRQTLPPEMSSFAGYIDYTRSLVLEPVGCYPPRTSLKPQNRRGMAQRVQKPGRLLPSYHLEILGGVEAGASYHDLKSIMYCMLYGIIYIILYNIQC